MAEVVGFTASIIAIIQLTAKAASLGYGYMSGVKRASDDLHQLVDELTLLGKVLTILQKVADSNSQFETLEIFNQPTAAGRSPLQTCTSDLRRLVAKLEPGEGLRGVANSFKWPFREKEVLQHIERVERHKKTFMLALNVDHIMLSKDIKIDVQEIKAGVRVTATDIQGIKRKFTEVGAWKQEEEAARIAERRKEVLQLIYPEAVDKKHNDISKRRRKNTGGWILREPQFLEWTKKNPNHLLLWAYGIPGAGKTFLSSVVISHLLSQAQTYGYGVAYIYFDYNERGQQKPASVLGCLVKQLASQLQTLPKEVDLCKLDGVTNPPLEKLFSALRSASKSFPQTFIVCDALDECEQKAQRNDLLPLFHQMTGIGIHLFITSRPHPEDINYSFKSSAKIELCARGGDIKNYIEQKIEEHPRAKVLVDRGNCKDKIISELITCAKGMFLLVHFHVEYLCQQPTVKKILTELEKLKRSSSEDDNPLKPTYDRAVEILLAQPKSCVDLATRIFLWLIKARRTLTVRELQLAVSVDQDCTTFDEMDIPERNTLLDVCASLVIIDEKSDTVKLAHYTIQEYLVKNPVIPKDAEFQLALACTTFLSYDIFAQGTRIPDIHFRARHKLYPFLSYAAAWVSTHLVACDENLTTELVLRMLRNPGNIYSYLQAISDPSYITPDYIHRTGTGELGFFGGFPEEQVSLHVAAALGHCSAVRALLEKGADTEVRDFSGRTVLYRMVLSEGPLLRQMTSIECEPMVRLLLEKGADTEARDKFERTALHRVVVDKRLGCMARLLLEKGADTETRDKLERTALHGAVDNGLEFMVRLLLEKGADTEARDKLERTALHGAVDKRLGSIARLLLEKGANTGARDHSGKTPLHMAVNKGWESMTRLLLKKGVDTEAGDKFGRTALHGAVDNRLESIAQLLLEKGADTKARDHSGKTVLHMAVYKGWESMIRLLLEKGADIEVRDNIGKTALHGALQSTTRLLLEQGADIGARDKFGRTALHVAADKGWGKSTTQLLLEQGADIKARDKFGRTALHVAADKGWGEPTARLLLEKGADTEARDNSGKTALHRAVKPTARLLLEKGAVIEARDHTGRTPLHVAADKVWGEYTIRLLLEQGADIEARDKSGRTALHVAADKGWESMIQLLLEKGADTEARDHTGKTPLHVEADKGCESMIQQLLGEGAGIEATDGLGESILGTVVSN